MKDILTREQLQAKIVEKAWQDENFKKEVLANPGKVIANEFGVQLPPDLELKVVAETAKVKYLVLPVNPDELTDEQLDSVAGGDFMLFGLCIGKCSPKIEKPAGPTIRPY